MHSRYPFIWVVFVCLLAGYPSSAQTFYFGNDLSYVNEMEDCGAAYKENGQPKDPYEIFASHGCNLVRLRLWHTPSWYDNLNAGKRYSDFADVKKSIARAKAKGMAVLLDFHLSDNWADPSKQRVPAAWLAVVDDLPLLQDSLYNYIYSTLTKLAAENLLPEMVQIGNETNKGILLSPADDQAGWVLDWERNAALFNSAIDAVRKVETETGHDIMVAIHPAGPENATWLVSEFVAHGVTDFDIIGISYYWAWHKPTTIAQTADIIANLRQQYPDKQVMIFETGYPWTLASADAANNIITELHPDYAPASPATQRQWLIDLTQAVMDAGGSGVTYWEPAWVSTPCWTQWGQGSHQEHATFFDFDHELIPDGGIAWMQHHYTSQAQSSPAPKTSMTVVLGENSLEVSIEGELPSGVWQLQLSDSSGRVVLMQKIERNFAEKGRRIAVSLPELAAGIYTLTLEAEGKIFASARISLVR